MKKVSCSIEERFVNPLFEVFDGGDLILTSYRDVERPVAEVAIYVEAPDDVARAKTALGQALGVLGLEPPLETSDVPDDDWKFAYRRHFKTELVSPRVLVQPDWEEVAVIRFDPGLAFGTGKHETTKACLQYIDEISAEAARAGEGALSFLDMGCGSGILSIAASKLGFGEVEGFDVDEEAVIASRENAAKNGAKATFRRFALGRAGAGSAVAGRPPYQAGAGAAEKRFDVVAANILGPLLIRFADEIVTYVGKKIIVSGILTTLYPDVLAAYEARGFRQVSSKTLGEWTTGLLERVA